MDQGLPFLVFYIYINFLAINDLAGFWKWFFQVGSWFLVEWVEVFSHIFFFLVWRHRPGRDDCSWGPFIKKFLCQLKQIPWDTFSYILACKSGVWGSSHKTFLWRTNRRFQWWWLLWFSQGAPCIHFQSRLFKKIIKKFSIDNIYSHMWTHSQSYTETSRTTWSSWRRWSGWWGLVRCLCSSF